eukprot:CAMPEP_0202837056 /NCGR_PEP_ID=MMETSP1389-20130828/44393_1 /ASSEMBLY_ACC=CAM_ASM_000865 /TAXON_ID=302021 /ORGANISM="Rhodomonas sp., Strain CCMP768" /LENGTH=70 /DNA_ID=CAMNT_0049513039 /DNA_START=533 /DNA_END=741 /DNA_ORIENTATION=+
MKLGVRVPVWVEKVVFVEPNGEEEHKNNDVIKKSNCARDRQSTLCRHHEQVIHSAFPPDSGSQSNQLEDS